MSPPSRKPNPLALALEWVAKITAVGLQMVLPGVAGHYLDVKLGTGFLAITGFALGMATGIWQVIRWSQPSKSGRDDQP